MLLAHTIFQRKQLKAGNAVVWQGVHQSGLNQTCCCSMPFVCFRRLQRA
jgi:hypothetical protein